VPVAAKDADPTFPARSVAVHVILLGPRGIFAGEQVGVTAPSTVSTAVTGTAADGTSVPAVPVHDRGTFTTGGVVSFPTTAKAAVAVLPAASAAVQTTRRVPRATTDPEGGLHVTGTVPSIASTAETMPP
jgi:hypothetical protein